MDPFYIRLILAVVIIAGIVLWQRAFNGGNILLTAVGIIIAILLVAYTPKTEDSGGVDGGGVPDTEEVTPTPTPSPTPTPPPSWLPANPESPYGKAVKENLSGKKGYTDKKRMSIVLDTYESRKDEDGENQDWYYSLPAYDDVTDYNLAIYYADDMPFFVEVRENKQGVVKLYYWGDELLMCRDKRGSNSNESYEGSAIYEDISREFSHIFEFALEVAAES